MQHQMCLFFTWGVGEGLPCTPHGDNRCTWRINLRGSLGKESSSWLMALVDVSLKQVRGPSIWHKPCPWPLALVNILGNCCSGDGSWAGISPAGCFLVIVPSCHCCFTGMLSGHRSKRAHSSALDISCSAFCSLKLSLGYDLLHDVALLLYLQGRKEQCLQSAAVRMCSPGPASALCADSCSGQAPGNKLSLLFLSGKTSEMKSVVGKDQYLVKVSLHLILSTASLWRTEGTFCYSASWFPSSGENLPFLHDMAHSLLRCHHY